MTNDFEARRIAERLEIQLHASSHGSWLNMAEIRQLDQLAPGQPYEPTLLLSPQRVNGMVEIRFRDNGTGIDEEVVEKIFNPLFSTRDGILGAGLGLAIAGDVVRRTGGSLSVDTASGEYAEFLMSLPAGSSTSVG